MSITLSVNPLRHFYSSPRKISPCRLIGTNRLKNLRSSVRKPVSSSSPSPAAQGVGKKIEAESGGCLHSSLILDYARAGLLPQAMEIWEQMLYSSSPPDIGLVSELMDALASSGHFDKVNQVLHQVIWRIPESTPGSYTAAMSCFGKASQLRLMNETFKNMVSLGLRLDSATGDEVIRCYSIYGTLEETEAVYGVLKRSRHLIGKQGVRSVSTAYIREGKFFRLGEFVKDVSLRRRDLGNFLWNLLLLSSAVKFKMKTLQRDFLGMTKSGFIPDIDTFNIRSLAFSRMSLFWDLHLSLQHMEHEEVVPDLVTVGCFVDAYLERRLGRNLGFALKRMSLDNPAEVRTDPLVLEAFGKGDFHSSSEAFMEFGNPRRKNRCWSYRELVAVYLKKQSRKEIIFWNY